jgi:hypothetical protein
MAPILGGLLASWLGAVHWTIGPMALGGMKLVFALSFAGRLTSLVLLARLAEPEAKAVRHVVRVLRNVRIPNPIEGLQTALVLRREGRHRHTRIGITRSARSDFPLPRSIEVTESHG